MSIDTDTPYSDAWRERTRARMRRLGVTPLDMDKATGIDLHRLTLTVFGRGDVSLEIAGPVDEWLAARDEHHEAKTIRTRRAPRSMAPVDRLRRPVAGEVVPVAVDLDALTDCDVSFYDGKGPR